MIRVLPAALLLTACSAGVERPPAGPALPAPPLTAPRPAGLTDPQPTRWDAATYVDPWTLDVHWITGVATCEGLAGVRVEETARTVTVTLLRGRVVTPETVFCPGIGFSARTRVTLREMLGARRLVDGATGDVRQIRVH